MAELTPLGHAGVWGEGFQQGGNISAHDTDHGNKVKNMEILHLKTSDLSLFYQLHLSGEELQAQLKEIDCGFHNRGLKKSNNSNFLYFLHKIYSFFPLKALYFSSYLL